MTNPKYNRIGVYLPPDLRDRVDADRLKAAGGVVKDMESLNQWMIRAAENLLENKNKKILKK